MALLSIIPFLVLLALANASTLKPTITSRPTILERDEFAIVPTTSGQIGINPVESDLGDPDIYNGEVFGTDTNYLALTTTSTAWIGVNTEYLTMETINPTSTSTIQFIVATATAAANGQSVGDISILLGEGLAQDLQSAANDLISACGALTAKKRLLRREIEYRQTADSMTCLIQGAAEPAGQVFGAYPNSGLPALEVAADASEVVSSGLAGYSGEQLSQMIVLLSFATWILGTALNSESTGEPQDTGTMGKVNIPALGFGAPPPSLMCTGNEEKTENSPICLDADCLGIAVQLCTVTPKVNCPCLLIVPEGPSQQQNASFFDMQQEWLMDVNDTSSASCSGTAAPSGALSFTAVASGTPVKPGTELRILPVGDSITVGYLSDQDGGDGNGYRLRLLEDLSADSVNYAGTITSPVGTMTNGFFAAWSGQTIQYIADNIGPSLPQRPNIVLIHAGTNDMNPDGSISVQGDDPTAAADRLGSLIDQIIETCPDATILVAMIINPTSSAAQESNTLQYQSLIPGIVAERQDNCSHVIAVDFTNFPTSMLRDGIHPTNAGYQLFGDYWYDFITQIPQDWINAPIGNDTNGPPSAGSGANDTDNGGIDTDIPPPDWTASPVQVSSHAAISSAAAASGEGGRASCDANPVYSGTGQIAIGLGQNGAWKYQKGWVSMGEIASGLGLDPRYVRLSDMNGDGKADYVWLDPETGEITCWLNNLPDNYSPAGTNGGIIGSGAGAAETVFLADLNGDGLADYLVVNPNDGSVDVYWNYGADDNWANGWKFVPAGQIASGVPHANLETLRFPDINGDGRADYVVIGEGGSLEMWLNTGSAGGQDVLFLAQGGIATGASPNISNLVFADMDGDGRDDYLIWDSDGGLTGFLNQRTLDEGVPIYIDQGPAKTIADGISQSPSSIILADIDGDGIDDYIYIDDNGALWYWRNNGGDADTTMAMDGLRFADIDGDGIDDYVWLDPVTGAPTVYLNSGVSADDSLGWAWSPLNGGQPIASGAAPASHVMFGDIDGDGKKDYLVLDPETGALTAYLNSGADTSSDLGWSWNPIGQIATGLGPGKNVRFADIDGDGFDDYIFLHPNGGTTIYRNVYNASTPLADWEPLPDADASGIGQRPEEIDFVDINGDGLADYVWTRLYDGAAYLWTNNYPNSPTWVSQGQIAGGVGTSGACVRYATLQDTGRSSYVAVNPDNGAIGGWLNGCANPISTEPDIGNMTCQGGTNWLTSSQWSDAQTQFCDQVGGKNAPTTITDYTEGSVTAELSLIWEVDCEQVPTVISTATCNSVLKSISEACPLNAGIGGGSVTLVPCYQFSAKLS